MASVVEEVKGVRMSRWANRTRADSRKTVLLEVAYKLYAKQVYALSLRLLASIPDAEQATVSAFVAFSRELPRRWDESQVRVRLRELAIDEALRRLCERRRKRLDWQARFRDSSPAIPVEVDQEKGHNNAPVLRRVLDSTTMDELIKRLPDEFRVAFVLHDMEGMNNQAIAKLLQLNEADARRLIARARLALRRLWLSQT